MTGSSKVTGAGESRDPVGREGEFRRLRLAWYAIFSPLADMIDVVAVKANMNTEAKNKLTEEELLAQMWYGTRFDLCFWSLV